MSDRESGSLGRILALVLRHAPEKFGVDMDMNGWVSTEELAEAIKTQRNRRYHWLRGWHFEAIANADEKGRYQIEGEMIRATYGHSIELELDLPTDDIPETLYWPCNPEEVETVKEYGITASNRKHVHLSRSLGNAMEAGHVHMARPTIIEVDTVQMIAEGHTIYRAGKTVFLCDEVPPSFIYVVDSDDPVIEEIVSRWEVEEAEAEAAALAEAEAEAAKAAQEEE